MLYAAYNDWLLLLWSLECLVADRHSVTPLRFMYMFVSAFNWIFVSLSRTIFSLSPLYGIHACQMGGTICENKVRKKINGWERQTNQHQFFTYILHHFLLKTQIYVPFWSSWKAHKIFRILIAFMPVCLLVCLHFKPFVEYHYCKNCAFPIAYMLCTFTMHWHALQKNWKCMQYGSDNDIKGKHNGFHSKPP